MSKDKANALERRAWILVVLLTAASLGIIWTVFVTSTVGERARTQARETDSLERESRIFSSGLGQILKDSRLSLEVLANHVENHPELNPVTDDALLSLIQVFQTRGQDMTELRAADRRGNLYFFDGTGRKTGISVSDRDYFRRQVPYPGLGFYIDRPFVSRVSGSWALGLSLALPPNSGSLCVIFESLAFSHLDKLIDTLSESPGEIITVFRSDGACLYQSPLPNEFPGKAEPNPLPAIEATPNTFGLLVGPKLRAYQRIEELPLWVVVSRPQSAITGDWEGIVLRQMLWVSLLTVMILASAIGLLVSLRRLKSIREAQAELARTDALTGLVNRRAFLERCAFEQLRVERQPAPLSLALLDVDHFKQVNDRFGHQAGDKALKDFARAVLRTTRVTDAVARTGGEEFAVLMPGTDGKAALDIAERVRNEVSTIALPEGRLTTSIGVALWDGKESFEAWYRRADQALYRAKNSGRNRVEAALPSDPS